VIPETVTAWESALKSRVGLYEIVIVSRPATFARVRNALAKMFKESPFAVVYDSEALTFRRDELLRQYVVEGIKFPGAQDLEKNSDVWNLTLYSQRRAEVALLTMTDVVVTVADSESVQVRELTQPNSVTTFSIGHTLNPKPSVTDFSDRGGILYVGAFHDEMYYNGDAIWYFLENIYPLVLEDTHAPIRLTIAGHLIPQKLRDIVDNHPTVSNYVTFLESPADLNALYDKARVFIAPHLYAAGIQFKLSEAFSQGTPVVMSGLSAKSFGLSASDGVGCIGEDDSSFAKCVLSVHNSESVWKTKQRNGLDFIRRTHHRGTLSNVWAEVIASAMLKVIPWEQCITMCNDLNKKAMDRMSNHNWCRHKCFINLEMSKHAILEGIAPPRPTSECSEGEELYKSKYSDVAGAIQKGLFPSAFTHWIRFGSAEGRSYFCYDTFFLKSFT